MKNTKQYENLVAQIEPHNIEAEEMIVGGIFEGGSLLSNVRDIIAPQAFFSSHLGAIFEVSLKILDTGIQINTLSIARSLESSGFKDLGGNESTAVFVDRLYSDIMGRVFCPNIESYIYCAEVIREDWTRRRIISAAREAISSAQDRTKTLIDTYNKLQDSASGAVSASVTRNTLFNVGQKYSERCIELVDKDELETSPAVSTGFPSVDDMTDGGLRCGELTVIAGDSGMGKSMFAFQVAMNVALSTGKPIFLSSMEMSVQSVIDRWISANSRVSLTKIRRREIGEDDGLRIIGSAATGDRLQNICLDEDSTAPLNQILSRAKDHARRHTSKHGGDGALGLIVIDNIQIAEMGDDEKAVDAINKFCKQVKQASKDLNVPIIILSQLNRASLSGPNKRPTKQSLHGGTGIMNNADYVWGLYRDDYYNPDTTDRDIAEILPIKGRNSIPNKAAKLFFEGAYSTFRELSSDCSPSRDKIAPQQEVPQRQEPRQITLEDLKPRPLTEEQLASIDYKGISIGCEVLADLPLETQEDVRTMQEMVKNGEVPPLDEICVVTNFYSYLLAIPDMPPIVMTQATLARESGAETKVDLSYLRLFK